MIFESDAQTDPPATGSDQAFVNPFHIADLQVFDDETMRELLANELSDLTISDLALALHHAPSIVVSLVKRALAPAERPHFQEKMELGAPDWAIHAKERRMLDALFWELTYWQTPDWYEDLIAGEALHPGIFRRLRPHLRDSVVLDAGAGSGRATLDTLRQGARQVYAVDPSPALLDILERKAEAQALRARVTPIKGRFDALPLADDSVDVTLSCATFTVEDQDRARRELAEMRRVTREGGRIVFIWPRPQDVRWLERQGFQHVTIPLHGEMKIYFRSLATALRIAERFYGRNEAVKRYLMQHREPMIPFSLLGMHPPHDYCWARVVK
jgi:ubiquinone/menaquinone biosynthesis C-methylase UbiE